MGTLTIEHANAMPAPTWHRLHVNDVDIELPSGLAAAQQVEVSCEEGLQGEADAFDRALLSLADPAPMAAEGGATSEEDAAMEGLDAPALSAYQLQALENRYLSPADVFTTGMGDEAREYLEFVAGEPVVLATRPDERTCATVRVEEIGRAHV